MSSGASLDLGTKIVKKTVRLGNGWNPHENQPHGSGYPYIRVRAPSGGKQDGKSPLQFFFAITFKVTITSRSSGNWRCRFRKAAGTHAANLSRKVELSWKLWRFSGPKVGFLQKEFLRLPKWTDWAAFCCQRRVERPRKPPWWSKCHT